MSPGEVHVRFLVGEEALVQAVLLMLRSSPVKCRPPIFLSHLSSRAHTIGPFAATVRSAAVLPPLKNDE
jgi:hypothetical protein